MTDVSAGLRPPCWYSCRGAPTWHLHTNLYKFGENVSSQIFHKKNCCYLNLDESLCISTFFLFPDSGLNLLNGFYFFYLDLFWMAWHWKPAIQYTRFSGMQVKWSRMVKVLLGPCISVRGVMNSQVWHRERWHAYDPGCSVEELLLECTSMSLRLRSRLYSTTGGCGKMSRVCWSVDWSQTHNC